MGPQGFRAICLAMCGNSTILSLNLADNKSDTDSAVSSHINFNFLFNPFPNKPWNLRVCSTSLLKTLLEKEKLLVTSNFSFSHSVFHPFGELLPFLSNMKLSSANSFSLEESKICCLGKG